MWVGISVAGKKEESPPENPLLANAVQKFEDVLNHIEQDYIKDIDLSILSERAIDKLLVQLGPHNMYLNAKELVQSNRELQGELEGIGIEFVLLNDVAYVITPVSGGPAERAGIKAGDEIMHIDDKNVMGQGLNQAAINEKLRGPKGTKIKLTVMRKHIGKLLDFTIVREKTPFYSVEISYMIDSQVGYIKIAHFTANTFKEFKAAFHELQKQGMSKLLLDLRGNSGDYMDVAVKIANSLLDQGQLIVSTKGKTNRYNAKYYAKGGEDTLDKGPVIVLIDEGTASAAEVIAGALQDNDRALIVGRRSFGKGLIQIPIQLQDGSQFWLSVARYYTPSGRFIQKPYGEGMQTYCADAMARYKQGEYFPADKIQFDDVLKHQTSKGRTVYSGGGIMPDYFIPLEVYSYASYLAQLQSKNAIQQYALAYVDQYRETLNAMEYEKYCSQFEVSELVLKKFIAQARTLGVPHDDKIFYLAQPKIKLLLKAYMARSIWGEKGFYPLYHQTDTEFQKSLQLFDEAEALIRQPSSK
mmetsp:Transcript_4357/g.9842  ORF Transcript_4357/g.9842 Transcript_4357/m.9842 type:complete len:527 (+) Transcript_4357:687-2267(+)